MTGVEQGRVPAPEKVESLKTYRFIEIREADRLQIRTTDPNTLNKIFKELKEYLPAAKLEPLTEPINNKQPHFYELHKLEGKDREVMFWFMERLGEESWEPFAVYASATYGSRYCFRKVIAPQDSQKTE